MNTTDTAAVPSWRRSGSRRRIALLFLVLIPTITSSYTMARLLPERASLVLDALLVAVFGILFAWISVGFWAFMGGLFVLLTKRDRFRAGLEASRFRLLRCQGSYFQVADYSAISALPELDFARWLTELIGVAAVPMSAFYGSPREARLVRFCFAKRDETLDLADRIAVIYGGRIVAVLDREDADERKLGLLMAGGEAVHVQ